MLVVSSGIFGRYVYARIPKTLDGVFLDDTEIEKRQQHLIDRLGTLTGLSGEELKLAGINLNPRKSYSIGKALVATLKFDMSQYNPQSLDEALNFQKLDGYQKQQARQLTKELAWTSSQRAIKEPFQKVFGYWHVFHIPLTAVMFLILIVHVIVAIMFGYTWIL